MNLTHLHLLINHLPIIGSILGGLVLAYGMWSKTNETKIAAYGIMILSSIGAIIAYLTGEPAEDTVEKIQGISKTTIHEHEDAALFALIALIILGIFSIAGIYFTRKKTPISIKLAWIILILSFISFSIVARTGYLGGEIRHTELNSSN